MKIQIIVGSTRTGRLSDKLAAWVEQAAQAQPGWEVELVDLAEFKLPFLDEAISPRYNPNRQPTGEVKRWLDTVAAADGYIVITPEYNHSVSGVLKNALDLLDYQFAKKPVAIVSHGVVGGARAAEHLKGILLEVKAAVVPEAIAVAARPSDDTALTGYNDSLKGVLTELDWWARTLAAGRADVAK